MDNQEIVQIEEIESNKYIACAACISVYADAALWTASRGSEVKAISVHNNPSAPISLIVLGCQVTDLAVLNTLKIAAQLKRDLALGGSKDEVYIGGCLGSRLDIPMEYQGETFKRVAPFSDTNRPFVPEKVSWRYPYWADSRADYKKSTSEDGWRFRDLYPIVTSRGCTKKCTYCTVRDLRPHTFYKDLVDISNIGKLSSLFKKLKKSSARTLLLTADSPSGEEIITWLDIIRNENSLFKNDESSNNLFDVALRNVEPSVFVRIADELKNDIQNGLISALHVPIQSIKQNIIEDMNGNWDASKETIKIVKSIKSVFPTFPIYTNIIIDYKGMDTFADYQAVAKIFDSVSWNPYWDGKWDINKAKARWKNYIG